LAQRIWPDYNSFPNVETAFFDVAARVGGKLLFNAIAVILFIACLGSGLAGQVGAARLLFGMGRDGIIPGKIFSHLDKKRGTPSYNLILMGVLTIVGSVVLSYQGAAELLNFGAFIAFMAVNIATFRQFFILQQAREKRKIFYDAILPIAGFIVCFLIWISLPTPAKVIGGVWFLVGLVYLIFRTRGLKEKPVILNFVDI
jgi:putrescine importer